ncbi:hypothetical protein ABW19_dt0205256 [Dactylella cylindrospora]|nr:hypothetical protein ABW19_dt0205256 [Dactylella cylindrospora]
MLISHDAPFSVLYIRIFSVVSFILSVGSTALLTIIGVCAWLEGSQLRVPFVVAAALNIITTALILAFSLWKFSILAVIFGGVIPSFLVSLATGGLWGVSVIQFRWLPSMVVARDTRWMLTATIAYWVLTLVIQVVFWTLIIALRNRTSRPRKGEILERDMDGPETSEISGVHPVSTNSMHEVKDTPDTPTSLPDLHLEAGRPRPRPPTRPARAAIFPRGSPTTAHPPQSPRQNQLEPSPFSQSASSPPHTSPFLNLLNRPKPKGAPVSLQGAGFPLPITEQEASNLAAFDEWDTSSLSMQDRILYSIAAAEASPDPGAPPHARYSPPGANENNDNGSVLSGPRTHRSSSMPTPPRTPPQRFRTGSLGSRSGNSSQQSFHIVSPIPTSPTPGLSGPNMKAFGGSTTQLRTLGIPLCDSPERERSARITSPLQVSTTLRDFESQAQDSDNERTGSSNSENSTSSNSKSNYSGHSRSPEDDAAWQAQWAATLERKVTPPMPGFEVGPRESMRRMREEREERELRKQQMLQMQERQEQLQKQFPMTETAEENLENGEGSRSTSVTPTAVTAAEAANSRTLEGINEMIDELREDLGVESVSSGSSPAMSSTMTMDEGRRT